MTDLSQIRFLVLDEADRMTQEHCFPQLLSILSSIHEANPRDGDEEDDESESDEEEDDEDRMLGLPGLPGEAKVQLLTDDILRQIEFQRNNMDPETAEVSDQEFEDEDSLKESENDEEKVHRQSKYRQNDIAANLFRWSYNQLILIFDSLYLFCDLDIAIYFVE